MSSPLGFHWIGNWFFALNWSFTWIKFDIIAFYGNAACSSLLGYGIQDVHVDKAWYIAFPVLKVQFKVAFDLISIWISKIYWTVLNCFSKTLSLPFLAKKQFNSMLKRCIIIVLLINIYWVYSKNLFLYSH